MDKRLIKNYLIFSTILVFALGTLLHFTYNLSNQNKIVAIFSSVNESVWEHLKLIFFPMLLFTIIGYFYFGFKTPSYLCTMITGTIISIIFMVSFHYIYSGIAGKTIPFIDISLFYLSAILGNFIAYKLIVIQPKCNKAIAITFFALMFLCFAIFTFNTPEIGIFRDPISGNYGI